MYACNAMGSGGSIIKDVFVLNLISSDGCVRRKKREGMRRAAVQ